MSEIYMTAAQFNDDQNKPMAFQFIEGALDATFLSTFRENSSSDVLDGEDPTKTFEVFGLIALFTRYPNIVLFMEMRDDELSIFYRQDTEGELVEVFRIQYTVEQELFAVGS